jgi:hypothetical protein
VLSVLDARSSSPVLDRPRSMIDHDARGRVSELLRHLVSGQITNDGFEAALPEGSADRAVREVSSEAWYLCGDLREHRLVGKERLAPEARIHVARTILFLQSDLEYECRNGPSPPGCSRHCFASSRWGSWAAAPECATNKLDTSRHGPSPSR